MGLGIERINRMNNKWRPPNWVVPEYIAECNYCLFEAGADAILTYLLSCDIISISQLEALNQNGDNTGNIK